MPLFGVLEAAAPENRPFDESAADVLAAQDRVTPVELPGPNAHLGRHTLAQWLEVR